MNTRRRSLIVAVIGCGLGTFLRPANCQLPQDLDKFRDLAIEAARNADKASEKANSAIDAANRRFDAVEKIVYLFSAMASVFLIAVAVAEFLRRKAEQERFDIILRRQDRFDEMTAAAATQQSRLVDNQISLGESVLLRSDEVLQRQIDTMIKMGDVIKLVEEIFDSRMKQEQGRETLQKELADIKKKLEQDAKNAQAQLHDLVITPALALADLRRSDWPTLSEEERNAAATARMTFRNTSAEVLDEAIKDKRLVIAQVHYVLGVSAYYSNDISEALRLLHAARKLYEGVEGELPAEHRRPAAFSYYYLGLIEKNWWRTGRPIEENFRDARHFLEEADRRHKANDEFLTPLTLIEVESYIDGERFSAMSRLEVVSKNFKELDEKNLLDIHRSLRQRAYLLRGNLNLFQREASAARAAFSAASIWWFAVDDSGKKTETMDPKRKDALRQNAFALLSIGEMSRSPSANEAVSPNGAARADLQQGLRLLINARALDKPELTTRGSNLAWAAIASHLISDEHRAEYAAKFFQAMARARKVGDRIPLFFDPISKMLITAESLVAAVKAVIEA
jgi:hypothetical protein